MLYRDIESYFINSDSVLEVIEPCLETFNRIDEIGGLLRNRKIQLPSEIESLLKELNGINIFLTPILGVATTAKTENEDREYHERKMTLEKEGAKVVDAVLNREASFAISNYRRVRNIIEAYISVVNTLIMSAQSLLKNSERERQNTNG
jgi:hypothetical protein